MATYAEKLKDPRWQKKRLEIFERDRFRCVVCFSAHKTLHVHHGYYRGGADPWDYEDETLSTLCEDCHQMAGELLESIHRQIAAMAIPAQRSLDKLLRAAPRDGRRPACPATLAADLSDIAAQRTNVASEFDGLSEADGLRLLMKIQQEVRARQGLSPDGMRYLNAKEVSTK